MKKIIISTLLLCVGINNTKAQTTGIATKGNNIVNVYYGVNLFTAFIKNAVTNAQATDVSVKSFGPVGLVYEHLVVDKIGLGFEAGYGSTTVGFKDVSTDYNGQVTTYNYEYKFTTTRIMFRANFHFNNAEKFDAYGFVSAGYRGSNLTFTSNDPNAAKASISFIPFGIKPGIGLRYFFTENIGLNLEIAAGTPIMSGGLSFKF